HGLRGRTQTIVGRHAQLDERDEPPVGATPFLVGVHAEAPVALLAVQKPVNERPGEDLVAVRRHVLTENVAPRQEPNRRLARSEQEVDRCLSRHARHEQMFTGAPTASQLAVRLCPFMPRDRETALAGGGSVVWREWAT